MTDSAVPLAPGYTQALCDQYTANWTDAAGWTRQTRTPPRVWLVTVRGAIRAHSPAGLIRQLARRASHARREGGRNC